MDLSFMQLNVLFKMNTGLWNF